MRMGSVRPEHVQFKTMVTEAVMMLCRSGLCYRSEFSIEGLMGITLDNEEVFLINIHEAFKAVADSVQPEGVSNHQQAHADALDISTHESNGNSVPTECIVVKQESPELAESTVPSGPLHSSSVHSGSETRISNVHPESAQNQLLGHADGLDISTHERDDDSVSTECIIVKSDCRELVSKSACSGSEAAISMTRTAFMDPDPEHHISQSAVQYNLQNDCTLAMSQRSLHGRTCNDGMYKHGATPQKNRKSSSSGSAQFCPIKAPSNQASRLFNKRKARDHAIGGPHKKAKQIVTTVGNIQKIYTENYACGTCGKTFLHQNSCKEHERAHRGIFKYVCELCGRGFRSSNSYNGHMVKHGNRDKMTCHLCPAEFNHRSSLKDHLQKHHWHAGDNIG